MNKRSLLFPAVLLFIFATIGFAVAQSGRESEGQAAEKAGKLREALTHYVAALQFASEGRADDQRLAATGSISEDGRTMTIRYNQPGIDYNSCSLSGQTEERVHKLQRE